MEYYGGNMTVTVDGVTHDVNGQVIKEIFRQLNIQTGKNILENYDGEIAVDIDAITDDEFEEFALQVENETCCDNGEIEWRVMERMFGIVES